MGIVTISSSCTSGMPLFALPPVMTARMSSYGWQVPDTPPGETSGLPVLLVVTQDERQVQRVLRILAGLSSRKITDAGEPSGRLNVRLSTVDRLSQKGPLGDCWQTSSLAY